MAWLELPAGTDPFDMERDILAARHDRYAVLPFAKINRGRLGAQRPPAEKWW